MALLTQARAKEYYNYDPQTGGLFFVERGRHEFSTETYYSRHLSRVGKAAGSENNEGYLRIWVDGHLYAAHRIAWLIMTSEWLNYPAHEIDHINGCRSDNRWGNLRKVTKSGNQKNAAQRTNNTSGVHGVNWKPRYDGKEGDGAWVARIWNGPKHVYLGTFQSIKDAAIARKAAERVLGYTGTDRPPSEIAKKRAHKVAALKAQETPMVER